MKEFTKQHIICADIGGTFSRLRFIKNNRLTAEAEYQNEDFSDFSSLLAHFIQKYNITSADTGFSAAVAGPVINQSCKLTNLDWQLDSKQLQTDFEFIRVLLLNDLEAAAWGILARNNEYIELNPGKAQGSGTAVIVGIGTGLGVAYAAKYHDRIIVNASEGGHMDFAPTSQEQIDLFNLYHKKGERISYEKLLSGPGIELLHRFTNPGSAFISAARINLAAEKKDENAVKTMLLFSEICASFIGNLALLFRPHMGIHLIGGVVTKAHKWLVTPQFNAKYADKGRLKHLAAATSVKLYLESDFGLQGAMIAIQKNLENQYE